MAYSYFFEALDLVFLMEIVRYSDFGVSLFLALHFTPPLLRKRDYIMSIMQKRLSLMHEVSKVKWNEARPIEDKGREEAILNAIAEKTNFNPWIVSFFKAQIEAAKEVQSADFACWQRDGVRLTDTELNFDSLRTLINRLNDEMLDLTLKLTEKDFVKYRLNQPISVRKSDSVPINTWLKAIQIDSSFLK